MKGPKMIDLKMKPIDQPEIPADIGASWINRLSDADLDSLQTSACALAERSVSPVHLAGQLVALWDELTPEIRSSLLTVDRFVALSGALIRLGNHEHADRLTRD